jgi:hypothetical protein
MRLGNSVTHSQMTTAMHKQFAWERTRDIGVVPMSTGTGDDARPRKKRKVAQTSVINGINYEPGMHPQNGTATDEKKASFTPFQSVNSKPANGGRDPPSSLEKSRKELPIFSGKQAILDAFQANDTIVILGEPGSGKTTRSFFTRYCQARFVSKDTQSLQKYPNIYWNHRLSPIIEKSPLHNHGESLRHPLLNASPKSSVATLDQQLGIAYDSMTSPRPKPVLSFLPMECF